MRCIIISIIVCIMSMRRSIIWCCLAMSAGMPFVPGLGPIFGLPLLSAIASMPPIPPMPDISDMDFIICMPPSIADM